ncbi:MAG: hypothetical protein ACRDWW_01120, partial [Acidimicrobiales bacterium]
MPVHLRLVVPDQSLHAALRLLRGEPSVRNLTVHASVAERPDGPVVSCDLADDQAPLVVADLQDLGVARGGSIAVQPVDLVVSGTGPLVGRLSARYFVEWEQL